MPSLQGLRERIRMSLWFVPAVCTLLAALLALLLLGVDHRLADVGGSPFAFGGTADGARSVLSAIAQSMLTFTGLVFTVTMLVLQLASSQLSPRVMRTFLRDRGNQVVLGLFVATFVYTLIVLLEVRTPVDGGAGFVPSLSVWIAFVLLLASVAAFVWYIDHMAHAIRASTVIRNIWQETAAAIEHLFPERLAEPSGASGATRPSGPPEAVLTSPGAGSVVAVDADGLLATTATGDRVLELIPSIGDFVPEDAPLVRLWGSWDVDAAERVRGAIGLGEERTLDQDAAFGIRQLVDIAIRALSPGINDPTTAVQALDRVHDLLRRLATRRLPDPVRLDDDGRLRLVLPRPGWEDYVRLAIDEARLAGVGQLQVSRKLRAILTDLLEVAPGHRRGILLEELDRLDGTVNRGYPDRGDREIARVPGTLGRPSPDAGSGR